MASMARVIAVAKPDAVFSVADIIVHRLRHRDDLHSLAIEFGRIAQCVITTNRDQVIKTEHVDVLQHGGCHI